MVVDEFNNKIEEDRDGSDWLFEGILKLKIKINIQKSILGKGFIELPDFIKYKKCCVNPKNDDDECFKWCFLGYAPITLPYSDEVSHKIKMY